MITEMEKSLFIITLRKPDKHASNYSENSKQRTCN